MWNNLEIVHFFYERKLIDKKVFRSQTQKNLIDIVSIFFAIQIPIKTWEKLWKWACNVHSKKCLSVPFWLRGNAKIIYKEFCKNFDDKKLSIMYAWRTWWECCITKNPDDSWIAIDYSNLLFGMAVWSSVSSCEHLLLR